MEGDTMNVLSMTVSRSVEVLPWTPNIAFPDVGDLLPLAAACLASALGMALWLMTVSGYISKNRVRTAR